MDADLIKSIYYMHESWPGNKYSLYVEIEKISTSGASAKIVKWLGPHNRMGKKNEGTIYMDAAKVRELMGIFDRYDLEGWTHLPSKSCNSGETRCVTINFRDKAQICVSWNAKFPKTIPPEEDVMYYELFGLFNGLVRESGWDEVAGEDLEDPRLNPAYGPRTVTWFGNQVKLKIGTGQYYKDGTGAEIDYEGKDWWVEEGFVGYYTGDNGDNMTVDKNGDIKLIMDGEEWHGYVDKKRIFKRHAGLVILNGKIGRHCELHTGPYESFDSIQICCFPGPVPAEQFTPINIVLQKCKDRFCRKCGSERKSTDRYCRNCGESAG